MRGANTISIEFNNSINPILNLNPFPFEKRLCSSSFIEFCSIGIFLLIISHARILYFGLFVFYLAVLIRHTLIFFF